ncbi:Arylsulfatase [Roseimaritima multifibrata]|uniref:Arylsulfatase n=1 Tax=Roseimaritima multifibrata TaxID=1930274 RepID=A0A517M9D0_9BACT|nr:sulfatase [Roseimaritima multifibrata]QDS91482.1 Arylsulfatase [Roseimaritima multifibrata]
MLLRLLIVPLLMGPLSILSAQSPNVLLICVDDLRPELNCYGKDYIQSPNIDALARRGRRFERHFVQAPTCGASRYAMLTGTYGPSGNHALFARADEMGKPSASVPPSMPAWFRQHGYTTVSVGKVSHHPGGRGGPDWDDEALLEMPLSWDRHLLPAGPWKHPRGAMHGLANGQIREDASKMDLFESEEGDDTIYPDGLIVESALQEMKDLAGTGKPFFLACGLIRPHLPFGAPAKYMEPYKEASLPQIAHPEKPSGRTTWHRSGEFMKYNRWGKDPNKDAAFAIEVRKHYAACVTYADAQVGRLLQQLEDLKMADNTVVVLWGDHGWHLGEHAIWGKHALFEESLHSPLIISVPGMDQPGVSSSAIVETIDLFPTLCELAELPQPKALDGVSLNPILKTPEEAGHDAAAYAKATTLRTNDYRLVLHPGGYAELYDHRTAAGETKNIAAEHPGVVKQLSERLNRRLQGR